MAVRRRVLIVLAVLTTGALLAGGWLAWRVSLAADALRDLRTATDGARPEVDALDVGALRARLPAVQDAADRAAEAADDPVWRLAEHLPIVGDDLTAVRLVSRAADDLARESAPDLLAALAALTGDRAHTGDPAHSGDPAHTAAPGPAGDPARAADPSAAADRAAARAAALPSGWVDLAAVVAAAPAAGRAAATVDRLRSELAPIDPGGLVGPVAGPVAALQDVLAGTSGPLAAAQEVAAVLPTMLGADGPRTYLLLSLNPAELRAQGGIVGAVAVLRADDGAVGLVGQRSTADLPELSAPVIPLTGTELALHGDRLGRWVQDTVLTPDFPRAAELAAAFWAAQTGQVVDGVVATDPVVVADVLAATGRTVQADGAEIGAPDLLRVLLRDAYLDYGDPRAGDAFYAQVAAAVFGVLRDAVAEPATARAVALAGGAAVDQRRVAVWSARPAEQVVLAGSGVGGAFLTGDAVTPTGAGVGDAVGVFLDDATAGKLGYDLDVGVDVRLSGCGTREPRARVTLRLGYAPPADVAGFPAQVLGDGRSGVPAGWLATNVAFYGARDGALGEVRRDGAVVGGQVAREGRREVAVLTSRLAPGTGEEYVVDVAARGGSLTVWTTPTLWGPGVVTTTCP